jgi:hypothetical protein
MKLQTLRSCTLTGLSMCVARGIAVLGVAVFVTNTASTAWGAGVVGTGTAASCTDADLNAALAGGGLVTFNCGPDPVTIDISKGTGTKTISADTTIDGGGLITISGGNAVRVFSINCGTISDCGVNVTVENLTIANGHCPGAPGGGGIYNTGRSLIVTNSTFTGNSCPVGGAIANFNGSGSLTVTNSTFADNVGIVGIDSIGAGIYNDAGVVTVANSTFTGNGSSVAPGQGGGIYNDTGSLTVSNSTFTGNSASMGGGIFCAYGSQAVLRNTIVANGPSGCAVNGLGNTDGGHNLDEGTSCGFSTTNGSVSNTDAQLDPAGLENNGGPTQTVALCTAVGVPAGCTAKSPAIDAGDQAVCAAAPVNGLDQRGFVRHTQCSIGAYEAGAVAPPPMCAGDCNQDGKVTVDGIITLAGIALGNANFSACPGLVAQQVSTVTITQIIQAVHNALTACPGA